MSCEFVGDDITKEQPVLQTLVVEKDPKSDQNHHNICEDIRETLVVFDSSKASNLFPTISLGQKIYNAFFFVFRENQKYRLKFVSCLPEPYYISNYIITSSNKLTKFTNKREHRITYIKTAENLLSAIND